MTVVGLVQALRPNSFPGSRSKAAGSATGIGLLDVGRVLRHVVGVESKRSYPDKSATHMVAPSDQMPRGSCIVRLLAGSRSPWPAPAPCWPCRRRRACRLRCRPPTWWCRRTRCPGVIVVGVAQGVEVLGWDAGLAGQAVGVELAVVPSVSATHSVVAVGPDAPPGRGCQRPRRVLKSRAGFQALLPVR